MRRRTLFLGWTLLVSWVLLEAILRVAAASLSPDLPGSVVPDPDAFRVLAVGDSWVAGAEAPPGQGFVDVVADTLPAALGRPVQVLNLGRNGGNSAHATTRVLDEVDRFDPHAVVVLVGLNNGQNLQGVAELDQRLGFAPSARSFQLRSVQAVRIGLQNLGLGDSPRAALPEIPPMLREADGACLRGDFGFGSLADATGTELCAGTPIVQAPLLETEAGQGYLNRFVDAAPPPSDDPLSSAAFALLYAAARGEASRFSEHAADLEARTGRVEGPADVVARYALLRHAREVGDWRGVRRHGGLLDAYPERGLLRDLGAAEARILAGDWPTARALLVSAHHRAPGFADVVDVASRFPEPARDGRVLDATEWPWSGRTLAREEARVAGYTADPPTIAGPLQAVVDGGDCPTILEAAEGWYRQRGDAHGYTRAVRGCLDSAQITARLDVLREDWGPLGDAESWRALVGADHRWSTLLVRHLEAIEQAAGGARVLVLTYPNPGAAFGKHRDLVAGFAQTRSTELVDLRTVFAERYDAVAWAAMIAPGGHCNAAGYRVMADEVVRRIAR